MAQQLRPLAALPAVGASHDKLNMNRSPKGCSLLPIIITCKSRAELSINLIEFWVSVFNPEAVPGCRKNHKLRLPEHHPKTDHPKEMPNVPTAVDRITCQHTLTRTPLDKCQPIRDPEPQKPLTHNFTTIKPCSNWAGGFPFIPNHRSCGETDLKTCIK